MEWLLLGLLALCFNGSNSKDNNKAKQRKRRREEERRHRERYWENANCWT